MIEVGEWVRDKDGLILKYEYLNENDNFEVDFGQKGKCITFDDMEEFEDYIKEDIVSHSKNIIDLIEVGDYVNGEKVFSIEKDPFVKGQTDIFFNRDEVNYWGDRSLSQITDKDIKSIVTKEQFANIQYRLED